MTDSTDEPRKKGLGAVRSGRLKSTAPWLLMALVPQECEPLVETFLGHIHPEDLELQKEINSEVRSKTTVRRLSYRIIRPDGEV